MLREILRYSCFCFRFKYLDSITLEVILGLVGYYGGIIVISRLLGFICYIVVRYGIELYLYNVWYFIYI